LIGATHNLGHHIVRQEKWTKDHTSGDTSHTAENCGDHAINGKFDDLVRTLKPHILCMEKVTNSHFALVDILYSLNSNRSHVHHSNGEKDDTHLLLCFGIFLLLEDHVVEQ
jgi:hypothetical protein